ncbi:5-methyltetrahydropteroyltriglutamate--homocysteine S-methyltransferase [Paenibacillus pinihumi]|uniref:5-methyltetrahydropteroyltriglutamate-- homocysteine S-methyltransferase n=1 Tax=Paenibacillus pinihumi TaxID=669462 RepID=UPI00041DB5D3|nr:5-methyltetrahydropteroyltriglutamate--homocysteine S-methyltransferase [Paenibacillus pinihumi]
MSNHASYTVSNLGYPRIGEQREWKKQLESYWKGQIDARQLLSGLKELRLSNLRKQKEAGVNWIPVGDFTLYDHVLDHSVAFGVVPDRFAAIEQKDELSLYFAMARGASGINAGEMTKWFNTNYHYIVPEWKSGFTPKLVSNPWLAAYNEAKQELGIDAKPVIVGPYTYVSLSKGFSRDQLADIVRSFLPVYVQVLQELQAAGASIVQIDEPSLAGDVPAEHWALLEEVYQALRGATRLKLIVQTYFDGVDDLPSLYRLPVDGFGLDFIHDRGLNLKGIAEHGYPQDKLLAAGIIDGRNIWTANVAQTLELVQELQKHVKAEFIVLQPSSSLLHVPVTLKYESKLPQETLSALAFADEKLQELQLISRALTDASSVAGKLEANAAIFAALKSSPERNRFSGDAGKQEDAVLNRKSVFASRYQQQQERFQLPLLPTTTIGSMPQTADVRKARQQWRKGELSNENYEAFIDAKIAEWIKIQEDLGIDVLVHGEFERNDMVEFFGEKLDGYIFTANGWVQSYGSRCVKPPVIYGDIVHTEPMTVKETIYAQSLTQKPVKGMLTGPLTMLNWSFVRNDLTRREVAFQLARAILSEVKALETAGIGMIQVDEPALREGAPLKRRDWDDYLRWGVEAFRLSVASAQDTTQIHTHMCYCDFHEILDAIEDMDADVISLETSRSHGTLIQALRKESYEKGIGLGVYDIHSPYLPEEAQIKQVISESLEVVPAERLWINPDCGLKTRNVDETIESLRRMVDAAKELRTVTVGS